MVSPDILGEVTSGAGVGASIAILLSFGTFGVVEFAFVFWLGVVLFVMGITELISKGRFNILVLVLAGIVILALFSSFGSLLKFLADSKDKLPEIIFWLMGSLARVGNVLYMFVILTVCGVFKSFCLEIKRT